MKQVVCSLCVISGLQRNFWRGQLRENFQQFQKFQSYSHLEGLKIDPAICFDRRKERTKIVQIFGAFACIISGLVIEQKVITEVYDINTFI